MSVQSKQLACAQRRFNQLAKNDVPVSLIPRHIEDIERALGNANGTTDEPLNFAKLREGVTHQQVAHYFAALVTLSAEGEAAVDGIKKLKPEMEEEQLDKLLQTELGLAQKTNALKSARILLQSWLEFKTEHYEPARDYVEERYTLPYLFAKAGLDTSVFENDARPKVTDLLTMVREAERAKSTSSVMSR